MSQITLKYQCKVCNYKCGQKSHIDSHKLTTNHLEKCTIMNNKLKINKPLFNEYIIQLNINEEDDKKIMSYSAELFDQIASKF